MCVPLATFVLLRHFVKLDILDETSGWGLICLQLKDCCFKVHQGAAKKSQMNLNIYSLGERQEGKSDRCLKIWSIVTQRI
jgi:hypothetical protein